MRHGAFATALVGKLMIALLFVLVTSGYAQAHTRSYSYSYWDMQQGSLVVRLNQYDLTRLDLHPEFTSDYMSRVEAMVASRLVLTSEESNCDFRNMNSRLATGGWVHVRAELACSSEAVSINSALMLDAVSSHMHFVTVKGHDDAVAERVLTESDPQWYLTQNEGHGSQSLSGYLLLGVEHILSGWDHLAFILGLLLLATSLRQLAWLITGFTVAHSLTLGLAVLGYVTTIGSAVEAIIGLSIVMAAVEYAQRRGGREPVFLLLTAVLLVMFLQPGGIPFTVLLGLLLFMACYFSLMRETEQPGAWRMLLSMAFGLFHGFGFAGILAEMSLPQERLVPALFGFNLGVELGQLLVVALIWPVLRWISKRLPVEDITAASIAGLGTFWFVSRAFI